MQTTTTSNPTVNMKEKSASNLYNVLQIKRSASPAQIKAAYRSLVKEFHPDANRRRSDSCDFIEIHDAYATLSDPMAKARYDLSLSLTLPVGYRCSTDNSKTDFINNHQTRRWETDQCW
ncbi:hypothetical protein AQUCO_03200087v1 [Aquilegia coerulea]|uniref:J domain-containing protein n=1 Tax=Aquilegia coerulea TaxID=218851 RepID=A0A2G5D108_AQUCA|nr:hypothetical protein AQUCO_03200087v1 [Aquilegia coerulea]